MPVKRQVSLQLPPWKSVVFLISHHSLREECSGKHSVQLGCLLSPAADFFCNSWANPFHCWFQEAAYSTDCHPHFSLVPGLTVKPRGESVFERRLPATLYQMLIHSVSFMGTSFIEQLLCAAQLSAKNTEVGDPRYHRVLKLTHYLHLHLQDSVCKGNLLDGPDLSSTNILKKLLMRTCSAKTARTTGLDEIRLVCGPEGFVPAT